MTPDPQHCSVTVALPAGCIVGNPSLSTQQREIEEFICSWPQHTKPKDERTRNKLFYMHFYFQSYRSRNCFLWKTFHCMHFHSFAHLLTTLYSSSFLLIWFLCFLLSSSIILQSLHFASSCFMLFFSPHCENIQSTLDCFISPLHFSNSRSHLSPTSSFLSVRKQYLSCSEY